MSVNVTLNDQLLFPSEYVGAGDLKGRDVTLTIADVQVADLRLQGGASKKKPVVFFTGTPKKLVMNKTNAKIIAALHGAEASLWVGKRITLYPTKTQCGGAQVDCVRVREKLPPPPQRQAPRAAAALPAAPVARFPTEPADCVVCGQVIAPGHKMVDGEQGPEHHPACPGPGPPSAVGASALEADNL